MKSSYIELFNGGLVLKSIQDKLEKMIRKVAPTLDPNAQYTLKQLFGKQEWARLSAAERCIAENCMLDFAQLHNEMDVVATGLHQAPLYKLSSALSVTIHPSK